jgi:hypothetical protein
MVRDVQTLSLRIGLDMVHILSPAWLFAQDAERRLADDLADDHRARRMETLAAHVVAVG